MELGVRFNNQECFFSEGKISPKIVYNGVWGYGIWMHVYLALKDTQKTRRM